MGDEPGDVGEREEISLTLPKDAVERLMDGSPSALKTQDAIKRAIDTQIKLDEADAYSIENKSE